MYDNFQVISNDWHWYGLFSSAYTYRKRKKEKLKWKPSCALECETVLNTRKKLSIDLQYNFFRCNQT